MTAGHDEADDHVDPTQEPAAEAESADAAGHPGDQPVSEPTVEGDAEEPQASSVEQQLAERTLDLQRVHAEYQNYRKRVERDRDRARVQGGAAVLRSLLTVLDDIGRAEQHGELEGGFKSVADQLRQAVTAQGLVAFGAEGDAFDPRLHEALFQVGESPDVTVTTVGTVIRTGYRVGDDVVRDAQVGVIVPAGDDTASGADEVPTPDGDA